VIDGFGEHSLVVGRVVAASADERALRGSDVDDADLLHGLPPVAYVQPGRFAPVSQTFSFPFPAGFGGSGAARSRTCDPRLAARAVRGDDHAPPAPRPVDLRDQLDIDSMDFLNFVIALHERLGVDVPERDYPQLATFDGCVEYLAAAPASPVPPDGG
jgi:acyl carrier protein